MFRGLVQLRSTPLLRSGQKKGYSSSFSTRNGKVFTDINDAVADIKDGSKLYVFCVDQILFT